MSVLPTYGPSSPGHSDSFETNFQFIDGGSGKDKIVVTVTNTLDRTLEISDGHVNGEAVGISEDLTIPKSANGTVTLTLPSGSLVEGKMYSVLLANKDPNMIPAYGRERYVFYHMYHPNAQGPIEEGVIVETHRQVIIAVILVAIQ